MVRIRSKIFLTPFLVGVRNIHPLKSIGSLFKWVVGRDGLLFILVSGIFVNLLSNQLQDVIQRQRYLEMLEIELKSEIINFNSISESYLKNDGKLTLKPYFSDNIYKAGFENGYILSIEPKTLSKLISYYGVVPKYNDLLKANYDMVDKFQSEWEDCIFSIPEQKYSNCDNQKKKLDESVKFYSKSSMDIWVSATETGVKDLFDNFNPTAERRNNYFMRFLMGDESLEFLK